MVTFVQINVTEMDLTMQQMSHEMSRVVEAIDLLQATAHHGNDSLGLKPVLAKLDVIKQGVLSSQAHSESLKRRLTAVEKIEAQHQDDIDSLVRLKCDLLYVSDFMVVVEISTTM